MKRYLIYLNWCMLITLAAVYLFLLPIVHWAGMAGALLGAALTCGVITIEYCNDEYGQKDCTWTAKFFQKDYLVELLVTFFIAAGLMGLVLLLPSAVFPLSFLACFIMMFFANTFFETLWRYTLYIYYKKHEAHNGNE